MLMRTEEVIVSAPEGKVVAGAVDVVETVCVTVRNLIGAVELFNHLLEWAVFRRNSIVVGKSDDLGDPEGESFAKFFGEHHCGKWISTVTVSDELKVFRQFCQSLECHTHGEDAGADTAVVGYLVDDDGAGCICK